MMNTINNMSKNENVAPINDDSISIELSEPSPWLANFISVYQRLSTDNLDLLGSIYHADIAFIDPIHQIQGFDELASYFAGLYQNLQHCDFVIDNYLQQGSEASLFWTMTYQHPKLNRGKDVTVYGSTHIKSKDGKVIYHRDFLDLGAMLYEQLPVLGKVIKLIKEKAAK